MIINIRYVGVPFSESLTDRTIRGVEELEEKYGMVTKAKILIKGNSAADGQAFCEIKLSLLNSGAIAISRGSNLQTAIIETLGKLEKQLMKGHRSRPFYSNALS